MRRVLVAGALLWIGCGDAPSVGSIEGEVAPAHALPVVLVLADGDVVAEGRVNRETGRFRLDVEPGTYDLIAVAEGYVPDDSVRGVEVTGGGAASLDAATPPGACEWGRPWGA
jgi:hypothetical protein